MSNVNHQDNRQSVELSSTHNSLYCTNKVQYVYSIAWSYLDEVQNVPKIWNKYEINSICSYHNKYRKLKALNKAKICPPLRDYKNSRLERTHHHCWAVKASLRTWASEPKTVHVWTCLSIGVKEYKLHNIALKVKSMWTEHLA